MTQVELAAALNVTQAAVAQWRNGAREPSAEHRAALDRALDAQHAGGEAIDAGLRRGPVLVPTSLWTPAFTPRGRFRLPIHLDWSGPASSRWRDAAVIKDLLAAYTQIMVEGGVADIVTWIDPTVLAGNVDQVLWPRCYEDPWRAALGRWALL